MTTFTKKPADISPIIEQHQIRVENRLQAANDALEMMTVFNHWNPQSSEDLLGDCERLQQAAVELHQAICKSRFESAYEQTAAKADLYAFLSETKEPSKNASQPNQHKKHTSEGLEISEHANESSQFIGMMINNRRGGIPIKEPDWVELREVRQNRDYNRKPATIDGKLIPITTFDNYCDYHIGMTSNQVVSYLNHMRDIGDELFLSLRKSCIGEMSMRKVKKLTAYQKQALLQVAQTGDKAATLAFIEHALQAGE